MKLSSLLRPDYILINSPARNKDDAITEILDNFRKHYKFNIENDYIEKTIKEREELGGTTFDSGIAIPHARLDNFDDILIGILVPEESFMDGKREVKSVVLILTSKTVSNIYLNTLASLIKISRDRNFYEELLLSQNGELFISLIEKKNIMVKEEVTVESIMSEKFFSTHPDATLKELVDTFYKNSVTYLPVLDDEGNFVGELNLNTVIKEGIPDYATKMGNLKFLKSFEPLERLFRKEDEIKVSEIMKKPSVVLSRDSSIIEAALDITNSNRRHIPVVENGKVVGVLALIDILNRILRS
ncbi:MAG: CBS domain-containing protein [Spirochaetia bacterium]|jgi:PTS system nitrogen regulatory IIA component|nr:CBS domain-containing protein [Spirochaetia bacterium]